MLPVVTSPHWPCQPLLGCHLQQQLRTGNGAGTLQMSPPSPAPCQQLAGSLG